MKKKISKVLWVIMTIFALLVFVVSPTIYFLGIWRIRIFGGLELRADHNSGFGACIGWAALGARYKVDELLSRSEELLTQSEKRTRRIVVRLSIIVALIAVTGLAYVIGQKYQLHVPYEYLGTVNTGDLLLFWIIYMVSICILIPIPKKQNDEAIAG